MDVTWIWPICCCICCCCAFCEYINRSKCLLWLPSANRERHPIAINLVRFHIFATNRSTLNISVSGNLLQLTLKNANCLGLFQAINLITLLTSTQKSDNEIYVYSDVRPITFRHSRQYSRACFDENGLFSHKHTHSLTNIYRHTHSLDESRH